MTLGAEIFQSERSFRSDLKQMKSAPWVRDKELSDFAWQKRNRASNTYLCAVLSGQDRKVHHVAVSWWKNDPRVLFSPSQAAQPSWLQVPSKKYMLAPPRETKRDWRENPIVFLDVNVGDSRAGRLLIELRAEVVPKTCENFRRLCTGETRNATSGKRRHYAHCPFHRVVRDRFCQSGDFMNHDGSGGECTFDQPDDEPDEDGAVRATFKDENFILKHTGPGVLSMVNSGPDTNTSQFYLHFAPSPSFDNKHVIFGCLMGEESFSTLAKMHQVATERGDPKQPVRISASGQLYPY